MKLDKARMDTRRRWLARAGACGMGAGLLGRSNTTGAQTTSGVSEGQVLIGQVLSLDGGRNDQSMAVRQGVETARRQINAAGGVWGRQIVVRVADDRGKPELAGVYARQLATDGALLLFGPTEPEPAGAVMQAAHQMRVVLFGPMAGWPVVRQSGLPLIFPVRAEPRDEFRALMAHAHGQGMRRAAFLVPDNDLGRQHLATVQLLAATAGVSEVLALPVPATVFDDGLDAPVRQLREHRTEFVFNQGDAAVYERLIRRARGLGVVPAFMGVSTGATALVHALGESAQGMVFSQVVPSPWDRINALSRDYQDAFHSHFPDADFSYDSLEGYLTMRALAEALRLTGRDLSRPALLAALGDVELDVAGFKMRYRGGNHLGSGFVDTAIVSRDGKFRR